MSDEGHIGNTLDRRFVLGHLHALRQHLEGIADRTKESASGEISPEDAGATVSAIKTVQAAHEALRSPLLSQPEPERTATLEERAFITRDPVVSLLQSTLEERLEHKFGDHIEVREPTDGKAHPVAATRVVRVPGAPKPHESLWSRFTNFDPRWELRIGEALIERLFRHKHDFNPEPSPPVTLGSTARLVLIGDWGTGLPRAVDVAGHARRWLLEAQRDGRDVHAIHLGDVYYSGVESEYDKRMMAHGMWPVAREEAEAIGSWCLIGNHDMYGGAWAYFEYLLQDDRFRRQRSPDGKGTSHFSLVNDDWRVMGLDTSWQDHLFSHPDWGALEDPQAEHVISAAHADDGRKLLLLSHHQLVSAYDHKMSPKIREKLKPALDTGRVRGWLWGHEHRCMTFADQYGVPFGSCIGHGGVPQLAHPESAPVPEPGRWEYRGQFESEDEHWTRFGFAVLDFDGPSVRVTYVDELGNTAGPPDGPVEIA